MNGGHDLGGMEGLGPINPEAENEEPWFHYDWEKPAFAMTLACGALGQWNLDESRHARERQHPVDYLSNTYYENWIAGLETLLVEKGIVTAEELKNGHSAAAAPETLTSRVLTADRVGPAMSKGGPVDVDINTPPAFAVGDRVRVGNQHPEGHTRAPRYVRGRVGTIAEHHGSHVFADANAHGERYGAHIYSVRFDGEELWGDGNTSAATVFADLWEPHLERVE